VDRDGAVRIDARCHGNERVLTWARTGPRGPTGPEGPLGPSDGYFSTRISPGVVSLKLPPGDCIATGGCTAGLTRTASQSTTVPVFGDALSARGTDRFALTPGLGQGGVTYETASSVPNMGESPPPNGSNFQTGFASRSTSGAFHVPQGGTVYELCATDPGSHAYAGSVVPVTISNPYVTAIRPGTLHQQ
jgi:hypothetical protein